VKFSVRPGVRGRGDGAVDQRREVRKPEVQLDRAAFKDGKVKQVIQKPRQANGLFVDDAAIAHDIGRRHLAFGEDLGEGADRGHGRAQFVADLAEEGVLLL
jgi:hypothetical protein